MVPVPGLGLPGFPSRLAICAGISCLAENNRVLTRHHTSSHVIIRHHICTGIGRLAENNRVLILEMTELREQAKAAQQVQQVPCLVLVFGWRAWDGDIRGRSPVFF